MKKIFKNWIPVLLWMSIIFYFSSNPDPYKYLPESWRYLIPIRTVSSSSLAEWIGQLLHFIEYAILAFLLMRALTMTFPLTTNMSLLTIVLAMVFALSDEIHQIFVPGRAFQVIDLLIDFLGSLFGVYLYKKLVADGSWLIGKNKKIEPRYPKGHRRRKERR